MANYPIRELPRQVWAYYHPFYGTPSGPTGRWLTWNEPLHLGEGYGEKGIPTPPELAKAIEHNPDRFISPGRRECYSGYYPMLDLYDCLDPAVLAQQARWAVQGGLDGLIWDFMLVGENNCDKDKPLAETIYDRSLRLFLETIEPESLELSVSILYDSYCWFSYPPQRIAEELAYIAETYLGHRRMLHFDGRLVVFLYATMSKHTPEDWTTVCSLLAERGLREKLFLVAGEIWVHNGDFHQPGLFDGFSAYNQGVKFLTPKDITDLSHTLRGLAKKNEAPFWSATLEPGFEGRAWHHPGRAVARRDGELYNSLWQALIETDPPLITVCSFNEWGEGTQIEPAREYGEQYLRLTAGWAARYKKQLTPK